MSTQETKPEPRRPKLRLPFDNRREDAGEWAFDHRAGLCVTLIAYLLLAIAFVGAKIVVGGRPAAQGFYIDLQQLEQLAAEHDGKEPSARHLARLIEEARRKKVRRVFYQAQYPASTVKVIAEDIGARSVKIDPLREDVIGNIGEITRQLTSGNE